MATVTLRYWAAAKEAAGVAELNVQALTLAEALAAGLAAVREAAPAAERAARTERYRRVLTRSSFLINAEPTGTRSPESITLPEDAVIEVLPPFAGG